MFHKLYGWGRSLSSFTYVMECDSAGFDALLDLKTERGIIARGLGRSYGDSSLNSGGFSLGFSSLKNLCIDGKNGIATVASGVTISELEQKSLSLGYFPFVVPGTGSVTIGGAIASDIHGKSHHKVGSFSEYLIEVKLLKANGSQVIIRPDDETSELFWATVGGMGLTGLILEAKIRLRKVESAYVTVQESRVKNLDSMLSTLIQFNDKYLYTVAWIDLSGKFKGRGIVAGANHSEIQELNRRKKARIHSSLARRSFTLPFFFRISLVNTAAIKAFNKAWFYKPQGPRIQHVEKFMHPLDVVSNWNIVYGKKGFVQYQFVVPLDKITVLHEVLKELKKANSPSFLSVLKSLGNESQGHLGFPMRGWTLAIDLPLGNRNLKNLFHEMDRIVINAGGRFYIAKDSRMNSMDLPTMYQNLDKWKKIKSEADPLNLWQSDQGRRLGLC